MIEVERQRQFRARAPARHRPEEPRRPPTGAMWGSTYSVEVAVAGHPADARQRWGRLMIARGVAGAVLAPPGDPLHAHNRLLAHTIVQALGGGRKRLFDVLGAVRSAGRSLQGYAVIGDPALWVACSAGARHRGECVFAPAPDADLCMSRILNA